MSDREDAALALKVEAGIWEEEAAKLLEGDDPDLHALAAEWKGEAARLHGEARRLLKESQ